MDNLVLNKSIERWGKSITKYLENHGNRKILIYGDDFYTLAVAKTIVGLGYSIECLLSDSLVDSQIKILPMCALSKYSSEQYFILAPVLTSHKRAYEKFGTSHKRAYEKFIKNGFKIHIDFEIMGIGGYTAPIDSIDSLLGFSRRKDDVAGFKIWESKLRPTFKIVILGNSTSDPTTGMLTSWPELLNNKILAKGYKSTLYNGAVTGYCSTQEFLKLNRDVLPLKPDLVISLGGYNDIEGISSVKNFPFLHKYSKKFYEFLLENPRLAPDSMYMRDVNLVSHGNAVKELDYMIWVNNMKKMHSICRLFSIEFISYFQPMVESENIVLDEVLEKIIDQFYAVTGESRDEVKLKNIEYCQGVQAAVKNIDYINDLTGIFESQEDVFYDVCHYTEKGNKIIAENIYKDIINFVSKRGCENE